MAAEEKVLLKCITLDFFSSTNPMHIHSRVFLERYSSIADSSSSSRRIYLVAIVVVVYLHTYYC